MASSIDPVRLGIGAFLAYTLYGMAYTGSLGTGAQKFAAQLKSAWGDTPGLATGLVQQPAGASAANRTASTSPSKTTSKPASTGSSQRYLSTGLHDLGGRPVVYDTQNKVVMQDPSWIAANAPGASPNVYGPSDVFLDASGNVMSSDQAIELATGRTS